MRSKKILAAVIAMAMVMSVYVALEQVTDVESPFGETASATVIGVDDWQGNSTGGDILNQTTTALYYGQTETITFNGEAINSTCYLYKPIYDTEYANGQFEVFLNYTLVSGGSISSTASEPTKTDVLLDRAGLWIVAATNAAPTLYDGGLKLNMSDMALYDPIGGTWDPLVGWFWVNSSVWTIGLSTNSVYYDKNESLTITVKDSDGVPITTTGWIDIWNVTDNYLHTLVYHKEIAAADEGVWTISGSLMHTLTHNKGAGTYRVTAYEDLVPGHTTSIDIYGYTGDTNGTMGYNVTFGDVRPWHGRFMNAVGSTTTVIRDYEGNRVATSDWTKTNYKWNTCGPFNPPEYWADYTNFTVLAGVPTFVVTNGTQFWNDTYDNEVKIKVKDYDGHNISWNGDVTVEAGAIQMFNKSNKPSRTGSVPIPNLLNKVNISITTSGDEHMINITPRNVVGGFNRWGYNDTDTGSWANTVWAAKGAVYVVWANSSKANNSEEWNGTAEFELVRAQNEFKWVNDGSSTATGYDDSADVTDGILGEIPAIGYVPLYLQFKIINSDYNYFGSSDSGSCTNVIQCAQNITISGNSLYTGALSTLPGFDVSNYSTATNTWTIPIIPTMGVDRGEIKITAKAWNKTISGKLVIGETTYWTDGSIVTVTPSEFNIDVQDQILDITITDAQGNTNLGATVYLCYINNGNPDESNYLTRAAGFTRDANNKYTWNFNLTQQTTNQTNTFGAGNIKAPRNLTVYVDGGAAGYGYALINMLPENDFEVVLSHSTMLAGQVYNDFTIATWIVGSNQSTTPSTETADKNNFHVKILNENGDDVTATFDSSGTMIAGDLTGSDAYLLDDGGSGFDGVYCVTPGTYTFYAYNNTHDSTGHNGTLVVDRVTVDCDKTPFFWMADSNISATFTITYGTQNITGYLRIDNMSLVSHSSGDYNRTWMNCSFNGDDDQNTDNDSIEIDYEDIINGVITIHDITANYLPSGSAVEYLTCWFKPVNADDEEGDWARAAYPTGRRWRVSVPTVTPDKIYIPMGRQTSVTIDVTGRENELLGDVYVRVHGAGVDQNGTSATTGSDKGKVKFSLNPQTTGNISLDVGESGRTVEDTVIIATGWILDISVSPSDVDEGESFTVTVKKEDDGTAVEGATVKVIGYGSGTTNADGEATFIAPLVTSDRDYTITASAEGYAPEPDTVTVRVINVPALQIATDLEIKAGATYEIAVSNQDTGIGVVGAIVTITAPDDTTSTYTTKAGGVLTVTAPCTTGDYTITATFGTFQSATFTVTITGECKEEPTPGFELLTLIAAIGVAFILLRRRRRK